MWIRLDSNTFRIKQESAYHDGMGHGGRCWKIFQKLQLLEWSLVLFKERALICKEAIYYFENNQQYRIEISVNTRVACHKSQLSILRKEFP